MVSAIVERSANQVHPPAMLAGESLMAVLFKWLPHGPRVDRFHAGPPRVAIHQLARRQTPGRAAGLTQLGTARRSEAALMPSATRPSGPSKCNI
jgi:hypothetical protein